MNPEDAKEKVIAENTAPKILTAPKNSISLSYNDSEILEVNSILTELQTTRGYSSETMKGLFLEILRNSMKSVEESIQNSTDISKIQEDLSEMQAKFNASQEAYNKLELAHAELLNVEVETIEVPTGIELTDTDVLLKLDTEQSQILNTIAQNRMTRTGNDEPEAITVIAMNLIFNRGALFNWGGEYWTGL